MAKNNRFGTSALISQADMVSLRKAINNPMHRLFLEIAWWTGERFGAIRQLQVKDCYLNPERSTPREEMTFRSSTRKADIRGKQSTRQVLIHSTCQEILRSYQPPLSGYLFPSPVNANKPMGFSACDKFLRAALIRCGLDTKGVSSHSFRRSFITRLSEQGTDPRVIQAITGHRDPKSLYGYIDVSPARMKNAIARL
jgi:integrase/recombinase XerD